MAQKNNPKNNVRKYRRPINLNIGMLIFFAVLIYVLAYVVMSMQTEKIIPYEVKEGSLAINYTYRALALREEQVVTADKSGYVNYFAREGERVALGNLVYTIDETGRLKDYLGSANVDENSLSDKELIELRSEITDFVHGFDSKAFSNVYDFKYSLKGDVLKLSNSYMMDSISSSNPDLMNMVSLCNAVNTGIVAYYVDGFEDISVQQVTMDMFNEKKYEKKQLAENDLVAATDPVYKLAKNENWSLVLAIEEDMAEDFLAEEYIKVRFLKNQYESWGQVFIVKGADGNTYMELKFNNSMITFVKDRFVDVELLLHEETGLKIPNTSIVNKEFFLIPQQFVTVGGEDARGGVLKETYTEEGNITSEFVETEFYSYDEEAGEYYIDATILQAGDNLILPDSQEKYTVSRKASLIGVYYMNKGYADFRQIQILYQNEEYAIVKSNTRYGLNVYDYVVLNAESVSDEQFIYN